MHSLYKLEGMRRISSGQNKYTKVKHNTPGTEYENCI